MTNMPNAPLIYTLGVVRFPRVPSIERFADSFHDLIRKDYPLFDNASINVTTALIELGSTPKVTTAEAKMYQFATHDRTWAFLLTDEVFCLQTNTYVNNEHFVATLKIGLEALLKVPELGIEWLQAIGLRYVDLVTPKAGEKLSDYLNDWVLPPEAPAVGDIQQGMYIASYKTAVGDLRFQSLRNPPATLPPDLDNRTIELNKWKRDRPAVDFALMDIDHGCSFDPIVSFDVDFIASKFFNLRKVSKALFEQTGKPHAMKIWNGEA